MLSLNKVMFKNLLPEIILNVGEYLEYTDTINLFKVFNENKSNSNFFNSQQQLISQLKIKHLVKYNQNHITKTYTTYNSISPIKNQINEVVTIKLNNNSIYYFQPQFDGITNFKITSNNNKIITLHLKVGTNIIDTYIPIIEKEFPFDCLNNKILPFVIYNGMWLELDTNEPITCSFEYITIKNMIDSYEWWITTNKYSNILHLPIITLFVVYPTIEEYVRIIQNGILYDLDKITDYIWSLTFPIPVYINYVNIICSSQNMNYQVVVEEINLLIIVNGMIGTRYTNQL